jgi:hypothetical protein
MNICMADYTRFREYCDQHESFNRGSENDKLARELQKMLADHGA